MDAVPVRLGRTWYNKALDVPGDWKVEVLDDADKVVHTASFTVTGEAKPREAAAPSPAPSEDTADSAHLAVVDVKFAAEIKDRDPGSAGTTFSKGDKVYAGLKLQVKEAETQVKVRWSAGCGSSFTSEPVTVKEAPGWRTWMYKTVDASGDWTVEVLDSEDKVVRQGEITVQ